MTKTLSDYERMRDERLPNWHRWGKQDSQRPDPETGSGSIYQLGKSKEGNTVITFWCNKCDRHFWEPGNCGGCGSDLRKIEEMVSEDPPVRIDHVDGNLIDQMLMCVAAEHRRTILGFYGTFYKAGDARRHGPNMPAAIRALLDVEDAQRGGL